MCWVVYKIGKDYWVGYFLPNGEFYKYSKEDKQDAEELCSYLNGGSN